MATGPQGIRDVNEAILQKTQYTITSLVRSPVFVCCSRQRAGLPRFVVNFDDSGQRVAEINRGLLNYGVFGGDSQKRSRNWAECALLCNRSDFTQQHS